MVKVVLALCLTCVIGCGGGSGDEPAKEELAAQGRLEVFSWLWNNAETSAAVDAAIGVYTAKYPNVIVNNYAAQVPWENITIQLETLLRTDPALDSVQLSRGQIVDFVGNEGETSVLESLNQIAARDNWANLFPATIRDWVSVRGEPYAVPVSLHRMNNVFLNRAVFRDHGLATPKTLGELQGFCSDLKNKGVAPLAIGGHSSWLLRSFVWDSMMLSVAGAEYHQAFWSGTKNPHDAEVATTLNTALEVLSNCANGDAIAVDWNAAVDQFATNRAAMLVLPSEFASVLVSRGMKPGEDFDAVPFPGSTSAFAFVGQTFAVRASAPNPPAARELIREFAGAEAQGALAARLSSVPPRLDVDIEAAGFDVVTGGMVQHYRSATPIRSCYEPGTQSELEGVMHAMLASKDTAPVIQALELAYPSLPR